MWNKSIINYWGQTI